MKKKRDLRGFKFAWEMPRWCEDSCTTSKFLGLQWVIRGRDEGASGTEHGRDIHSEKELLGYNGGTKSPAKS